MVFRAVVFKLLVWCGAEGYVSGLQDAAACSKCLPPVFRHLLTQRTVFSKTVFRIARSIFRMYSVMAIFNSPVVWGLFQYTEFFHRNPEEKNRAEKDPEISEAK